MDDSRGSGSVAAGVRTLIHRSRLELAIAPSAVRIARHWTADQLARAGRAHRHEPLDPDLVDSAVLVVSELVTNAIRVVRQASPVGMMLPARVLSFGDRAGYEDMPGLAGQAGSMFAPGWTLPHRLAQAHAQIPVLTPVHPGAGAGPASGPVRPAGGGLGPTPASVSLIISRFSDVIRIDVHDSSPVPLPPTCHRDAEDETGRGLTVVAALAQSWGWRPGPLSKLVWCELAASAGHVHSGTGG